MSVISDFVRQWNDFSLLSRRRSARDEGVYSVKIVDPAIMFDFAIALGVSQVIFARI